VPRLVLEVPLDRLGVQVQQEPALDALRVGPLLELLDKVRRGEAVAVVYLEEPPGDLVGLREDLDAHRLRRLLVPLFCLFPFLLYTTLRIDAISDLHPS
jgi:hypothetical protein